MEPISTAIAGIVGYLASQIKKEGSIIKFISEFSEETVKWIKPLFLKDDKTPQDVVQKLIENPESKAKQNALASSIESELEDKPGLEKYLKEIYEKISKNEDFVKSNVMNIQGNNNNAFQDIKGSNININSNNQTHNGTGDNVGRDKIIKK
jgi:hypothetical protein